MRSRSVAAILALVVVATFSGLTSGATASRNGKRTEYVVLYSKGVSAQEAHAALDRLGADLIKENEAIGLATVKSRNPNFLQGVMRDDSFVGAARNQAIGHSDPAARPKPNDIVAQDRAASLGETQRSQSHEAAAAEPLAHLQWDMQMMHATVDGSYAVQPGNSSVLVGIIDTGVDGSHPDIAPNFDADLSRNFTTDDPLVDGKCNKESDHSCSDPADVDENGHGTHVAGTVASPLNGLGMAGVAPNVTIVNLRAGQDSGYFFLQPSVDALTYAGDHGIDVVNMSYYIDPWLYNCTDNPADSPEDQMEQRTIIEATQRAADYAYSHGVTLIGAAGNSHTDLGNPTFDDSSPDYPPGSEYPREVDNSCLDMPTEANHVMSISALGPSERKSYYSNYGVEQTTVSAPGGDYRDFYGTEKYLTPENLILAPYPLELARAAHEVNGKFKSKTPFVVTDCRGKNKNKTTCAVYQYLQGTSMASPHATGVAALIVSHYGHVDGSGLGMNPAEVESILRDRATDHPCPAENPFTYPDLPEEYNAFCEGNEDFNGFYGDGIADALNSVTTP